MGEYAKYGGSQIKMGTCENMYYLRADQRARVVPESGSLDPRTTPGVRFRFPFPDEDGYAPGDDRFHKRGYFRGVGLYGVEPPEGVQHDSIQFKSTTAKGMLVSLPCPKGPEGQDKPYKVHFNGFSGPVEIVQQKPQDDVLMLVCRCGCCGTLWRCETLGDCSGVLVALETNAERADFDKDEHRANYYREIGRRIVAGYQTAAAVTT